MALRFHPDLLRDRVALITGGGTGIGRAIALAFAQHGCSVAIASRSTNHLQPTFEALQAAGARALAVPGDVRDPSAVDRMVGDTVEQLGRLDILVNGAAGNFLCLAEALSPNGFAAVVDIDLKGTFHCCRAALPHLRATHGCVLNISATLHYGGTVGQLHVSAAKAGVDALTRNLAVEWGRYGIRVNGVAPGPVEGTEGVSRLLVGDARRHVIASTPLGRLGTTDDVVEAALFLSSASFVSGTTLVVDGGLALTSRAFAMDM
jgi:2,4-dienoyl-CoA reductase [(3E)-enoyl-CoA-producing], peroxisomal